MEIRPIDMQLVINKATDVNKVHDNLQQNMDSQQLFANEFAKTTEHQNQSVVNTQKGEDRNIGDGGGGNKGGGSKRKKKRKSEKEEEEIRKKLGGSIFDVSV